jgi:hypothetical protein
LETLVYNEHFPHQLLRSCGERKKKKKMVDDDLVHEDPKDWEQIQASFSSQPHNKIQFKERSMVVIRDSSTIYNDYSIFPPINHENLYISSHISQEQQYPLSPSSSSSSSSPPFPFSSSFSSLSSSSPSDFIALGPQSAPPSDSRVKRAGELTRWIGIGFEVLRCKALALVSSFRNYHATKGAFWSFGPLAAAAVVFWMLFMRARRRRRQKESLDRLMEVIKEKDEVGF